MGRTATEVARIARCPAARALLASLLLAAAGCHAADDDAAVDDDSAVADDDSAVADDDDGAAADDDDSAAPLPRVVLPCDDSTEEVYQTPDDLPPWDASARGAVVRCSPAGSMTLETLVERMEFGLVEGVEPFSGATTYRILYRTTRWEGQEGLSSAYVYLPDTAADEGPLPVVVANHATTGLADFCALSLYGIVMDQMALPFVGTGYAVIAPDNAGLGTEGTEGYGDFTDTAHSVLDAARALRSLVTSGSLAPGVIVVGHSQGGGAVLSAQALDAAYGEDDVIAAVSMAPGWVTSLEDMGGVLRDPGARPFEGAMAPVHLMMLVADATNHLDPGLETSYFREALRQEIADAVASQCLPALLESVPALGDTYADVIDPGFAATAAGCVDGTADCGPPGQGYVERLAESLTDLDPEGAPLLILQGLQDEAALPGDVACIVDAVVEDGVTPQVCTLEDGGHDDIVPRTVAFALDWVAAVRAGQTPPACDASDLPACDP